MSLLLVRRSYASALLFTGLGLAGAGGFLVTLGGSSYYALAGVGLLASGALIWRGDARGARLYGALLVATVGWALWETGVAGWPLLPRLVAPIVLGLPLLAHGMRGTDSAPARFSGWPAFAIALLIAAAVGVGLHALGPKDVDPLYQRGVVTLAPEGPRAAGPASGDWPYYGGDMGGTRFSALDQLNPGNASQLQEVWRVRLGAAPDGVATSLEVTPLKVGDALYVCTGYSDVLSLNPETGAVNWRFHAKANMTNLPMAACRGVAYYRAPGVSGVCAERIITNTVDARLIALDARTGARCQEFGVNGETSLQTGLTPSPPGYYYPSSAPTIVRGKIVLGGQVRDVQYWGEPSGVIRAYDAITGKLAWAFDMGRPGEHGEPPAGQVYTHSTPNSWAPMSADETLGLVYAPTGNAAPDYFGGYRRSFDEKYASALVALDADTGDPRWVFQTTHHDLWDYDVPSQPTLVDLPGPSGVQHALIQPTKRGEIFLLDRETGKPLAAVSEKSAPQDGIAPGERVSPTQPYSDGLPSFVGPRWRERDMWGVTPVDQLWCRIKFREARYEGSMTPPGLTPNIEQPYAALNWGGVSLDPERGLMVVNSDNFAAYDKLVPRREADALGVKPVPAPQIFRGGAQGGTPYAVKILNFLSPLKIPCNAPPYGRLSVVDLKTRKLVWSNPLGTARDSGPWGMRSMLPLTMGLPNIGGSVTTRGGLIFIAAAQEQTFRAIDIGNGTEVWSARLPAGGQATPATYWSQASGRQFVVLAVGGSVTLQTRLGDYLIAYALPPPTHGL
jgi:quinoprotein glucose dehydrogenase